MPVIRGKLHPARLSLLANALALSLAAYSAAGTNSASVSLSFLNELTDFVGLLLLNIGMAAEARRSMKYPFGTKRGIYVVGLMALLIFSGTVLGAAIGRLLSALSGEPKLVSRPGALYAMAGVVTANAAVLVHCAVWARRRRDPSAEAGLLDAAGDTLGGAVAAAALATGSPAIDAVGSAIVAAAILASAASLGYRYYQVLVGRSPPRRVLSRALREVLRVRGVADVNVFNAIMITEDEYMLILEVETDEGLEVREAERLSAQIEEAVRRADPRFKHVFIEFVPRRREPPTYPQIAEEIEALDD